MNLVLLVGLLGQLLLGEGVLVQAGFKQVAGLGLGLVLGDLVAEEGGGGVLLGAVDGFVKQGVDLEAQAGDSPDRAVHAQAGPDLAESVQRLSTVGLQQNLHAELALVLLLYYAGYALDEDC